jgi:hypothetical protein
MASVIRGSDNFDSLVHQGLGVNQTWQDVTGSRAMGTTYTNSTGKPIQICINMAISLTSQSGTATLTISSTVISIYTSQYSNKQATNHIIPNGGTYSIAQSGGSMTIERWMELR